MRSSVALLVLAVVATVPAAAQWHMGLEIGTTHYRGSSRATADSGGPQTFRPANATQWGVRFDRAVGRTVLAVRAAYARVGLTAAGPGLTLIDNSTGQLVEGQLLVNFQVAGIGSSGAIRAEVGPSLHLWKSAHENRTRMGGTGGVAYEWPIADRFSGAIRLEGTISKSWFDAGDLPPEYERQVTWRYSVGLGLRYRL